MPPKAKAKPKPPFLFPKLSKSTPKLKFNRRIRAGLWIRCCLDSGFCEELNMATPVVIVGAAVGTAALGARYLMRAWQVYKARPAVPVSRRFYPGGFEQVMTRREAALILGVREHSVLEKIKEAHRRVMVANHPDAGGSHYLASKINEAKDVMLKKSKVADSAF